MTVFTTIGVTCAACGTASEQTRATGVETVGFPDLDLRPPEMRRSTMHTWLQECPSCGYVASDLSAVDAVETAAMAGDEWRALVADRHGPDALSKRFDRRSFLERAGAKDGLAAFRMLCAAWDADDRGDVDGAKRYRERAVPLLEAALDGPPSPQLAVDWTLQIVDVLRRLRRWDEADAWNDRLFDQERLTIRAVAAFNARMILEGDDAKFGMGIALEEAGA